MTQTMQYKYPLIYEDDFGKEQTTCITNGNMLQTTIRGVSFQAHSFNTFEVNEADLESNPSQFSLRDDMLSGIFKLDMPSQVIQKDEVDSAMLHLQFDYTEGNHLYAALNYGGISYSSGNHFEDTESLLLHIQGLLPKGTKFKNCLSCKYSNYHPIGNNDFGSLFCLKAIDKSILTGIKDKDSLLDVLDNRLFRYEIEQVQETHSCPKHQLTHSGSWSYKSYQ